MKCAIVGYGHVGQAMAKLFPGAVVYDEPLGVGTKEAVNQADACFICVPTPKKGSGECDTQIVEHVIVWVQTKVIIIRSTVPVGFTKTMVKKHSKRIVFQPEYYGETIAHPFADLRNQNWLSFGGEQEAIDLAIEAYKDVINSNVSIHMADSDSVELAKYMENAFLATKVIFCNEMFDLAAKLGVNYNSAREIWLADPRIGRSHTFVYQDRRGFGGSCLPKDTASLLFQGESCGADMSLLRSVIDKNESYQ